MAIVAASLAGATLACLLLALLCRRRIEVGEQDRRYFSGEESETKEEGRPRRRPRTHASASAARARQLADVLPLVAEMLRGGASPESAFATVASCTAEPLGGELSRVAREVATANRTLPQAIESLARRTKDADLDLLASAVAVQKEGGGNLADVLDSLALTVQKKTEMRGHIEAITSSARMSAAIVGCMPPALLALLSLASPSYMADFWASGMWPGILAAVAALDLSGIAVIRRLYDLDLS